MPFAVLLLAEGTGNGFLHTDDESPVLMRVSIADQCLVVPIVDRPEERRPNDGNSFFDALFRHGTRLYAGIRVPSGGARQTPQYTPCRPQNGLFHAIRLLSILKASSSDGILPPVIAANAKSAPSRSEHQDQRLPL